MFRITLPRWYTTPTTQVVLVGITCFATVGMFSAVSNLGAGGQQDVSLSDTSNGVLYGFFAVTGLISGGICNVLGPPLTLFIGTLGYALYVGALWCHQTTNNGWFLILAGALLGMTAALLWSAQGQIMMSYPLEKDKGKAFAIFWAIFQFGTFIGSLIALIINLREGKLLSVATSTYIAFLIIIFFGIASSFLVLGPNRVIRGDGTIVKLQAKANIKDEVKGTLLLFKDWRMLALLPMSFASNYFYAYQGALNANLFDGTTRALNAVLESLGAVVGALFIGYLILDVDRFKRRSRGYAGLGFVTAITIVIWSVTLAWQVTFTRADFTDNNRISFRDHKVYPVYFGDACYQALVYWIMSALSNDPFTLARFAGFYKAIQSAGSAGSFGMDAVNTPFLNELLGSWIMMLVSFPLAFIVIRSIKDTNYTDEKMVYVDDIKGGVEAVLHGEVLESASKGSLEKGELETLRAVIEVEKFVRNEHILD
ncbi:hypothetical protein Clacol_008493 [Clathrus columnatus]|uniref:MFS general substrate transporter n=1 Tax=Clathrus columnatus TaxID=1419009 RepID=A0AAV5AQT3_9AGAM|nr:hypothetical protein Clacol_008493 [Clathrus columnatus]